MNIQTDIYKPEIAYANDNVVENIDSNIDANIDAIDNDIENDISHQIEKSDDKIINRLIRIDPEYGNGVKNELSKINV